MAFLFSPMKPYVASCPIHEKREPTHRVVSITNKSSLVYDLSAFSLISLCLSNELTVLSLSQLFSARARSPLSPWAHLRQLIWQACPNINLSLLSALSSLSSSSALISALCFSLSLSPDLANELLWWNGTLSAKAPPEPSPRSLMPPRLMASPHTISLCSLCSLAHTLSTHTRPLPHIPTLLLRYVANRIERNTAQQRKRGGGREQRERERSERENERTRECRRQ